MPSNSIGWTAVVASLICLGTLGGGQSPPPAQDEPLDLVNSFWRQEVKGKRLTEEGWNELIGSCISQPQFPGAMTIDVISRNCGFSENKKFRTSDFAYFDTGYSKYGEIDPKMRYVPAPELTPEGVKLRCCGASMYVLLTDASMVGPPTGRKVWKILEAPRQISVDVETAIRYVRGVRDSTRNPVVKRNAVKTLADLAALDRSEARKAEPK